MYTGVHSDVPWESGYTSKEQATFIKASQALMWILGPPVGFIVFQIEIDCGNAHIMITTQ